MMEISVPLLILTNVLAFILLCILLWPSLRYQLGRGKVFCCWVIVLLFCLFSFWGSDWFHYFDSWIHCHDYDTPGNFEPFYVFLIRTVTTGYLQFRVIIWGGALFLVYLTIRRLRLPYDIALFCFVLSALIWVSYARASWAMALMFYGASLLASKDRRLDVKTAGLGILCIALSLYLHKSAYFGVAVIAAAFVSTFSTKKVFGLLLVLFPVLLFLVSSYLGDFLAMESDDEMLQASLNASQQYLSRGTTGALRMSIGIGPMVSMILEWVPRYLVAIMCYKNIRKEIILPKHIQLMNNTLFVLVFCATLFFFNIGADTSTLFGRFLRFSTIPSALLLSYFYQNGIWPKMTRTTLRFFFVSTLYTLVYQCYCAVVQ